MAASLCVALGSCRSARETTLPEEGFFKPLHSVDRKPAVVSPRVDNIQKLSPRQIGADSVQGVRQQQACGIDSPAARAKPVNLSQSQERIDSSQISGRELLRSPVEPVPVGQSGILTLERIRGAFLAHRYRTSAEGCEEMLRRGVPKKEEDQYLFLLGRSYYHLKRYDLAAASLKKVASWKGTNLKPDAHFVLGLIYKQLGVSRQARSFFDAVIHESPGSDLATQARAQLQSIAPKK